ncbi:MAG: hypothetical protein PVH00_00630, partial [Gemmatimonadota bacterium]
MRTSTLRRLHVMGSGTAAALVVLLAAPRPVAAQIANGSTAALGMGENYMAVARGLDAVAWNPAGLGLFGTGSSSWVAMVARGGTGIGPVTLGDLADWSNERVPAPVKRAWLARIAADGGESGSADADVTWFGLQFGRFAVHASTSVRTQAALAPGIAELLLFGNVGESGEAQAVTLSGSSGVATAHSAIGASWAMPLPTGDGGCAAVGLTVKYVVGHALAVGDNSTGNTTVEPISVLFGFPTLHSTSEGDSFDGNGGAGLGLDLGLGWDTPGGWSFGLAVQNVVNTFDWDPGELSFSPLHVHLDSDTAYTETDEVPASQAPASLRTRVDDLTFRPVLSAGAAYRVSDQLMVAGDARLTSDTGIRMGAARHVGAGLEYRPVPWLPIHAGGAAISSGR